ncbi:MAG: Ppx/GppA phosphatase family protein [Nitriliruptor sp.]
MRCSVLDLGSNSFHVLVADLDGTTLVPVEREREMLHLGRVVAQHGHVPEDQIQRAERTVAHLSDLARRSGSQEHVAVATSALRDAEDGRAVLDRLAAAAGTEVRVLSGEDEARLGYLGVRAGVSLRQEPVLVLDLGGGSLELTIGSGAAVHWSTSLPVGVSRLSALVDADPARDREVRAVRDRVVEELGDHRDTIAAAGIATTVAVGGTVRALARMIAVRDDVWLPATLNQLEVTTAQLVTARDQLVTADLEARAAIPGVKQRRADHIHIAATVLVEVLEQLGLDRITVSDWGLREGILLDAHGVRRPPSADGLRRREIARLRERFPTDADHLDLVTTLALRLFDDLRAIHRCDDRDRELLAHAAQLHDIGETLALRRHPVHGAYLVANAELHGFSPIETAVLTTLVRSYRSRGIDRSYPPFAALPREDQERTRRLLPLLQIAERLDRARDGAVRDLRVTVEGDTVTLEGVGQGGPPAPLDLERMSQLFTTTYERELRLAGAVRAR